MSYVSIGEKEERRQDMFEPTFWRLAAFTLAFLCKGA